MDLKQQLQQDFLAAMKAKEQERVGVLRLIRGKIKDLEIDKRRELNSDEVIGVLMNAAKQRLDSIKAYREGSREDLAAEEERELVIIKSYLPEQMGPAEIEKIVIRMIAETGATSMKDIGKVMPKVMAEVKGRANGSEVQAIVRSKLA